MLLGMQLRFCSCADGIKYIHLHSMLAQILCVPGQAGHETWVTQEQTWRPRSSASSGNDISLFESSSV